MKNIVKVTFDLGNPNQKPHIEIQSVDKETSKYYIHRETGEGYINEIRTSKQGLGLFMHDNLSFGYIYATELDTQEEIEASKELRQAVEKVREKAQVELDYYQKQLNGIVKYFNINYVYRK